MRLALFVTPFLMCGSLGFAEGEPPLSAIPWLTESLSSTAPSTRPNVMQSTKIESITVEVLREKARDGAGLLAPEITGFPLDLWKDASQSDISQRVAQIPYGGTPAVRSLFRQLMLAQSNAPKDAEIEDQVLLARLDRLLDIGALNEAQALIEHVGADTIALFRRWFDIGILTGQGEVVCGRLSQSPMLSPSRNVQVFCLATQKDWDAAATALTLGEGLGEIKTADADLLAFFLDASLLEEIDPPEIGNPLTSLEFLIRESVGLPRPDAANLPLAFLHAELGDYVPLRFRIEAAEALVQADVLPPSVLFASYREEAPAASGGVWERVAAIQDMDAADTGDAIATALKKLDLEFRAPALRSAVAEEFLLYLSDLPPASIPVEVHDQIAALLLLADAPERAKTWISIESPKALRDAYSIAAQTYSGDSELETLLSSTTPEAYLTVAHQRLIEREQIGLALISALTLLGEDEDLETPDVLQALALLRATGQDKTARQTAVEHLLLTLDF